MLKRSLTETPVRPVDKLFVPPTFAEAISQAIHAVGLDLGRCEAFADEQQQPNAAQQMLEDLWYRELIRTSCVVELTAAFMFKDPPRVIIALTRHPKEVS